MNLTTSQERAVRARGNVVLSAGAGTGKTKTLVERCLSCLLEEPTPASISEMLLVTFTDAAAAEMRHRIRARLEEEFEKNPGSAHWQEQLALFEQAHIGTLHSFCLKLARQHFHELHLDPQLAVMPEAEARLVAEETLDAIFQRHYDDESASAVRDLIQSHGRGGDAQVKGLVRRLHDYSQTLPDAAGWLRSQRTLFASPEPQVWEGWLLDHFATWSQSWLATLAADEYNNVVGRGCYQALQAAGRLADRQAVGRVLEAVREACLACPKGKKKAFLKPLKEFTEEAEFMRSLVPAGGDDPLREDWNWSRHRMTVLLELAETFGREFAEAKRQSGVVDFHDLEQHALRLLWNVETGRPTLVAAHWRRHFRFVFVDEYQDINAAQDKIIEALSREGEAANRFLVGDVKQSIYRFRLANPRIFQGYRESWGGGLQAPDGGGKGSVGGNSQSLPLLDNFRTRERLLDFINSVFGVIMRPETGGIAYDESARLVFGAPDARSQLSAASLREPCVELHLRLKKAPGKAEDEDEGGEGDEALAEVADLEEAGREARLVGLGIKALYEQQFQVWGGSEFRSMRWTDAAVLLRSPATKAEHYAREFARLNIPLVISRSSFYEGLEIKDLVSLLQILDNPLQDGALVAVLRSPFARLDLEELAEIRLVGKGFYWFALTQYHERHARARVDEAKAVGVNSNGIPGGIFASLEVGAEADAMGAKVADFLDRYRRWRRLARQGSISKCLETVLAETQYDVWLAGQPRGAQRRAKVEQLLGLARQFDSFQRQGLFRFLNFLEAQKEADLGPNPPGTAGEDAVRLMSIHQSKGLEFPVVALGDLGKTFNTSDLRGPIILDDHYGLCPQVRPPDAMAQYPSVAHWLAQRRQHAELLGDELRLLYVAMTRARDRLLLAGSIGEKKMRDYFELPAGAAVRVSQPRCYSDWIGFWFAQTAAGTEAGLAGETGRNDMLQWRFYDDAELALSTAWASAASPSARGDEPQLHPSPPDGVRQGERSAPAWHYPFEGATREPAKASVSALKRRALTVEEDELSARPVFAPLLLHPLSAGADRKKPSAVEIGSAHHRFLEQLNLSLEPTGENLERERQRMITVGLLEASVAETLDLEGIRSFWCSDVGRMVRAETGRVRRELQFTARFPARELAPLFGLRDAYEGDEPVIVQGTADLVVLLPREIWLLDFKTDRVKESELAERREFYRPQLELYARALARIYNRPATRQWLHFLSARKTCEMI